MKTWPSVAISGCMLVLSCWVYDTLVNNWYSRQHNGIEAECYEAAFRSDTDAPLIFGSSRVMNIVPWMLSPKAIAVQSDGISTDLLCALLRHLKNTNPAHKGPVMVVFSEDPGPANTSRIYAADAGFILRFPEVREVLRLNHVLSPVFEAPGLRYFGGTVPFFYSVQRHLRFAFFGEGENPQPFWLMSKPSDFEPVFGPPPPADGGRSLKNQLAALMPRVRLPERYTEEQVHALETVVRDLAPSRVYIIRLPIHPQFREFLHPVEEQLLNISTRLSKVPNVTVLDYTAITYGDECFFDHVHMTQFGAYNLTRRLMEDIAKSIPSYRN